MRKPKTICKPNGGETVRCEACDANFHGMIEIWHNFIQCIQHLASDLKDARTDVDILCDRVKEPRKRKGQIMKAESIADLYRASEIISEVRYREFRLTHGDPPKAYQLGHLAAAHGFLKNTISFLEDIRKGNDG